MESKVEEARTKIPLEVEVGERVFAMVADCCQGEKLKPPAVSTRRAPEEMDKPVPVMSVMRASEPIRRLSVTVVVAFNDPATLNVSLKVEDA